MLLLSQSNSLDQLLQCRSWCNISYWGNTSQCFKYFVLFRNLYYWSSDWKYRNDVDTIGPILNPQKKQFKWNALRFEVWLHLHGIHLNRVHREQNDSYCWNNRQVILVSLNWESPFLSNSHSRWVVLADDPVYKIFNEDIEAFQCFCRNWYH